jgi:aryl-alcohol dehydrogenase-like predicted oxidoreductase
MSASAKHYPTRQLGRNGPFVSAIGFGAMGVGAFYGESDENNTQATLTRAADRGVTFWDTSDYYGTSETSIGSWFSKTGRRSEIFLATKFGGRDERPGGDKSKPLSKPSYILHQLQASLKALQTDYIDLYYQHRVDHDVPIEVVMETLRPAVENGTIKYLGLSECSLDTLRRAKAVPGIGEKVIAAQMEFSPFELYLEKTGFAAAAKELGVAIVAYSPLCRGLVSGR